MSSNNVNATKDLEESLDCIKIYLIPPIDQSIVRNAGFELSYRRKRGELTSCCLQSRNKAIKKGFQEIIGIGLRWNHVVIYEVVWYLSQTTGNVDYIIRKDQQKIEER